MIIFLQALGYSSAFDSETDKAKQIPKSSPSSTINSSASSVVSSTESAGFWPRCLQKSTRSKEDEETGENLDSMEPLLVIHGDSLSDYTEEEICSILRRRHCVFARTTPAQKIQLIKVNL